MHFLQTRDNLELLSSGCMYTQPGCKQCRLPVLAVLHLQDGLACALMWQLEERGLLVVPCLLIVEPSSEASVMQEVKLRDGIQRAPKSFRSFLPKLRAGVT